MSLATASGIAGSKSFPRVSGDEPVHLWSLQIEHVFSPRERG